MKTVFARGVVLTFAGFVAAAVWLAIAVWLPPSGCGDSAGTDASAADAGHDAGPDAAADAVGVGDAADDFGG